MPEHQQTQQSKITDNTSQKQTIPPKQIPTSHPAAIIQRARINPKSLTHADIMQLQRTIGNRAVGRLLSEVRSSLKVQQVPIQRQEIPEEEPLQGKMRGTVQRQEIPEKEEPLQMKNLTKNSSEIINSNPSDNIIQKAPVENTGEGYQLADTRLQKQVGPSCWLFVLDAIFHEFNDVNYRMGVAKFFYPTDMAIAFLKENPGNENKRQRIVALEEIINRINNLIKKVTNFHTDLVSKNAFKGLVKQVIIIEPPEEIFNEIFSEENAELPKQPIIQKLDEARRSTSNILAIINDTHEGRNDEETLLNNSRFDLGGDSAFGATVLNYKAWFKSGGGKFPMYMYLNSRFIKREEDNMDVGEVDWTGREENDIQRRENHAVLLVGADYGNRSWQELRPDQLWNPDEAQRHDDGFIVYKDPNYGNARIKIKWSHLKTIIANNKVGPYFGLTSHQ